MTSGQAADRRQATTNEPTPPAVVRPATSQSCAAVIKADSSRGDLSSLLTELTATDAVTMLAAIFQTMDARLTEMVKAEYEAKKALTATVDMIVAQRTRENTLLNEMSELLLCTTMRGAGRSSARDVGGVAVEG